MCEVFKYLYSSGEELPAVVLFDSYSVVLKIACCYLKKQTFVPVIAKPDSGPYP